MSPKLLVLSFMLLSIPLNEGLANAALSTSDRPQASASGQESRPSTLQPTRISLKFRLPRKGAPNVGVVGGATRGQCTTGKTPLMALIPSNRLGLTTETHPTFFLYVPETKATSAELVLKDIKNKDVYRTKVALTGVPGVVSVKLPQNAPALEVDKYYRWYFSMACQPDDRLEDVFVGAWVQRVAPDASLANSLRRARQRDLPRLYAENGIWHDSLAALALLREANPKDTRLAGSWRELLRSVGLNQVSEEPLVAGRTNR
ncbi:MAG: DUF928 domain-containing protein [Leptolyngbyaceae cyanobacterium bins.59]|nr:DUF928 domain-containing protein [Leptolyngbyaceae cyanobacterium bins.59]